MREQDAHTQNTCNANTICRLLLAQVLEFRPHQTLETIQGVQLCVRQP